MYPGANPGRSINFKIHSQWKVLIFFAALNGFAALTDGSVLTGSTVLTNSAALTYTGPRGNKYNKYYNKCYKDFNKNLI